MVNYAQKIMESPDAIRQIEQLQAAIAAEQARRREFREWLTPPMGTEFIDGQITLQPPSTRQHWHVSDLLGRLLSVFVRLRGLGISASSGNIMITLRRNDYQPDLVFYTKAKADTFTDEQMLFPAPDFVVEILSRKTAARDRGVKLQDYAAHGIGEYWIIDPEKQLIEQYLIADPTHTVYAPAQIFELQDTIQSRAIEGFKIPVAAIFDASRNLETLQQLLAE